MGAFSGMKDAKRGFSSNPLRVGRYLARIDSCEFFEFVDRNGKDDEMWKNTLTILKVEEGDHKVGEIVHTFFKAGVGKKTFQSNLKSFIAGVLDQSDDLIDEATVEKILSADNPMRGLVTVVTGRLRPSKTKKNEKGEPFEYTVYSWAACMGDEDVRAEIGEEAFRAHFPNSPLNS